MERRLIEQKKIEEKRKISKKNDFLKKTSKQKDVDHRTLENEKKKKEIIDTKKKALLPSDKVTQITVINKSGLQSSQMKSDRKKDSIIEMKKDVQMVKNNIEQKIKKDELAKKREKEIMARRFSYFKESKNVQKIQEDNTKLFYDENVLKKSFLKKDQIIEDFKMIDNKKKLPNKKNQDDNANINNTQKSLAGDMVAALSSPQALMQVKEFKSSEKREILIFSENEIDLGLKQKKRIREYINLIMDKPVKIIIGSSTPSGLKNSLVEKKKQKTRALLLRTFLINHGISHNRISIKIENKRNISKNWKNELTLIFIDT